MRIKVSSRTSHKNGCVALGVLLLISKYGSRYTCDQRCDINGGVIPPLRYGVTSH